MALVDWEAVVLDLEAHVMSRNSHGQRDLLRVLTELKIRHRQVEGLPEKALRLYGPELAEALDRGPAGGEHEGSPAMVAN